MSASDMGHDDRERNPVRIAIAGLMEVHREGKGAGCTSSRAVWAAQGPGEGRIRRVRGPFRSEASNTALGIGIGLQQLNPSSSKMAEKCGDARGVVNSSQNGNALCRIPNMLPAFRDGGHMAETQPTTNPHNPGTRTGEVEPQLGDELPFGDAVEAIKFFMERDGLTHRDLVPLIGTRSKVSEVLSGTRPITMPMARALHRHLGIPADVLLKEPVVRVPVETKEVDWRRFPLRQMVARGWVKPRDNLRDSAEELVKELMGKAGDPQYVTALYRKNDQNRANAKTDPYALDAWCWQVLAQANERSWTTPYRPTERPLELMAAVARESPPSDGPRRAVDFLNEQGIAVEIVPHLSRTHLDGAAMKAQDGRPVIGLTLRYDRIDNFWWVLMHELAHAMFHLDEENPAFIDDLKLDGTDDHEREADALAQDALIRPEAWENSEVAERATPMAVISLAHDLGIHPSIVAGRARFVQGNYRLLSQFVGTKEVNHLFASFLGTGYLT